MPIIPSGDNRLYFPLQDALIPKNINEVWTHIQTLAKNMNTVNSSLTTVSASGTDTLLAENKSGGTLYAGTAVMLHASGTGIVQWTGARNLVGLVAANAASGVITTVQVDGVLELSDWTSATGSSTLTPGMYYCSTIIPGRLTTVATTTIGDRVQQIGQALSTTKLQIEQGPEVLL